MAENNGEVIRPAIIQSFAMASNILAAIQFETINGNAISYNPNKKLPGVGFRGVNESFSTSHGVVNPQTEALTIAGGDLDVDKFLIDTIGGNIRERQEAMQIEALALAWERTFLKGDSGTNPRVFDGLQKRLVGAQVIDNGAGSVGGATNPLSLTALDELIDAVRMPTHLIMNAKMRRLLSAASRNSNVGGIMTSDQDAFGRRVVTYNDLEILVVDEDNQEDKILDFQEGNLGDVDPPASTSIYCVSFRPGMCFAIQGRANGSDGIDVRDLGELQNQPLFRTRVEWYTGLMIENGRSAARLRYITADPVIA